MNSSHLTLLFLLCKLTVFAQINLVPNYSFESNSNCPTAAGQIGYVSNWYACNAQKPDYFNACQTIPTTYGVPLTIKGYQLPKTGNAFVGIETYGLALSPIRAYIQIELTGALKAGKSYRVSFNVNLANNSTVAITQMGAYLSTTAISSTTAMPLPFTPQIISNIGNYLIDTLNWTDITDVYKATGGEKYLTIGNFKDEQLTDTIHLSKGAALAYYNIDDVSVTAMDTALTTVPNIFTPNNDGKNDQWEINNLPEKSQVKIYNRWGVLVGGIETPLKADGSYKWDGYTTSGIKCVTGTYYYIITNETTKKGFIQLIGE